MSSNSSTGSYTKGELSLGCWDKGPSQDYSAPMDVFKQLSIAQHAAMKSIYCKIAEFFLFSFNYFLAEIDGTTTKAMYQEFGLDLED